MAIKIPLSTRPQDRFPGLQIRLAEPADFPRMARMANEVFQQERDIEYFTEHRRVKVGDEREVEAANGMLAVDADWRLTQLRLNHEKPGRHFILATYFKNSQRYLLSATRRREEILGWAEWQEPPALGNSSPNTSGSDHVDGRDGPNLTEIGGSFLGQLESIVKDLTFRQQVLRLLVPPNGLTVYLQDALESFRRASADNQTEWDRWCNEIIPTCLGVHGDVHRKHLVLRSLVVKAVHWDNGIGHYLLNWGKRRAQANGWGIQTLATTISESTLQTFREADFRELGRMNILRDTQIALRWAENKKQDVTEPQRTRKRKLEPPDVSVGDCKRICRAPPRHTCTGKVDEKHVGEP
ncbi:hypothetical protein N657DRAFT_668156 [Parathielavia appendiculata]|uniref:Uncharacterized protein n=1 Tax=Parathielavia appendiculata TaxID=2587402 RepID=A0AAN6UA62_9PEZI|nr:hypothetical protein N657DRAFT_668156 [Parathielavia appendiculata]